MIYCNPSTNQSIELVGLERKKEKDEQMYTLFSTRLIALFLLVGQCSVNSFAPVEHVKFLIDHSVHLPSFLTANGDIVNAHETISSVTAALQHALGISSVDAASVNLELPPITLPELNAGEAAEYVGSNFGRVGSNFVKMSGLENAPENTDRFLKQSAQLVEDLKKSTG